MLSVEVIIHSDIKKVWNAWVQADQITHWYFASPDWHCPKAEIHVVKGGRFAISMEAKDGTEGFVFSGVYTEVVMHQKITATLDDGRLMEVYFLIEEDKVRVVEKFEREMVNPPEMQLAGWQAILHQFKLYVETN